MKHLAVQARIRLISQLINGISRVLQKLLKYFNSILFLTSLLPIFPVLPAIFVLNLNKALLLLLSSAGKSSIELLAFKNG